MGGGIICIAMIDGRSAVYYVFLLGECHVQNQKGVLYQ